MISSNKIAFEAALSAVNTEARRQVSQVEKGAYGDIGGLGDYRRGEFSKLGKTCEMLREDVKKMQKIVGSLQEKVRERGAEEEALTMELKSTLAISDKQPPEWLEMMRAAGRGFAKVSGGRK